MPFSFPFYFFFLMTDGDFPIPVMPRGRRFRRDAEKVVKSKIFRGPMHTGSNLGQTRWSPYKSVQSGHEQRKRIADKIRTREKKKREKNRADEFSFLRRRDVRRPMVVDAGDESELVGVGAREVPGGVLFPGGDSSSSYGRSLGRALGRFPFRRVSIVNFEALRRR